jgi:YgiT-type zinc finger domain-containing protein
MYPRAPRIPLAILSGWNQDNVLWRTLMAHCPACGSHRIRNGYRQAPLPLRAVGIRELLCDYCNRQFRAFSPRAPKQVVKAKTISRSSRPTSEPAIAARVTTTPALDPVRSQPPPPQSGNHRPSKRPPCPQCNSQSTYRRRRNIWERMALSISGKRAYVCESCGESFYAASQRLDEELSG